jgi:hypothetical protein
VQSNAPSIAKTYVGIGGNATFQIPCYVKTGTAFSGSIGGVYRGYVIMNYTDIATAFSYTVLGSLVAKVNTN